ncbi:hypothetical protein H2198_005335 [Neophaeococcomyces mojaviensis]|uniref:Uncharacterized protein n=1 Tax=Neophaeococcomyces mojaviensis TaxID=3383035 RepID=A0ACC3A6I3_9EURO|nr:hypothetical protein H2198_005335 [Knufia sp. JES_112]
MASYESRRSSMTIRPSSAPIQSTLYSRRQSSISTASPTSFTSPRVQLIPHSRTPSYDGSLSPADIEILANTNFDSRDVSSKDFDFEDVFTYDKPQRKLKSVVEVSSPTRNWSNYPIPHYQAAAAARQKTNRPKLTSTETYLKKQGDVRKR